MNYLYKLASLQDYAQKESYQYFEMFVYAIASFFIPFYFGHPQIAVGIIVNAMLITAALNLKGYKLIPIIISPALGVFARGIVFGPYTNALAYLIPFIWLGNALLILSFKWLRLHFKKNYLAALAVGSITKSGFLFLSAFVLYSLGLIPSIFLAAMGIMQLITAFGGGIAAYVFQKAKYAISSKNI